MKVFVTGGSGFVGRTLLNYLAGRGHEVVAPTRIDLGGDIDGSTDWSRWIQGQGIGAIVHLANRAHVMGDSKAPHSEVLSIYRRVNVEGTLKLAKDSISAGIRRFVYVSSVKVNGEERNRPYQETDKPEPQDPYGISKLEAELGLAQLTRENPLLETVILRPPLVYGPGVKANFAQLARWVKRGLPLPLGSVQNLRSLISARNLSSAIEVCLSHPQVRGETFLVKDARNLSTPDLIRNLAAAMGRPARLIGVPPWALRKGFSFLGRRDQITRLTGSLTVDDSKFRSLTGWAPTEDLREALSETIRNL